MLEHFDERARACVALAQDEARRLGHEEIGTVHLLLGVAGVAIDLLDVAVEPVRAAVVALHGSAPTSPRDPLPFSAEAKGALQGANTHALRLGQTVIDPAHLLLALLDAGGGAARALREAGATPSEVRQRATAAAGVPADARRASRQASPDHLQNLRNGHPLAVTLGRDALPFGDIGSPAVDAYLLKLMLARDSPAARLLRGHGVDEAALRSELGPPSGRA